MFFVLLNPKLFITTLGLSVSFKIFCGMSVVTGETVPMKEFIHEHKDFMPLKIEKLGIQLVLIVWYIEFHS